MKLRTLLDTYRQNFRMTQWPKTVLDALEDPRRLRDRQRLLKAAKTKAFEVVVMQAQDRFSRGEDGWAELKELAKHVEVWFYAERQRFEHGTLASNVTGFLRAEFAAEFRRAIAQKTHEAMLRRAQQGHATGGRIFGYDHVRINGHVERRINDAEADVVRTIYQRYADGDGFKQIAHALNAQKVPSPRPQRNRPAGWEPSTVRAVLKRDIYRGTITYNKTKKRLTDGSRKGSQQRKPESECVTVDAPQLRFVAPDLVDQVDDRLEGRRHAYPHYRLQTSWGISRSRCSHDCGEPIIRLTESSFLTLPTCGVDGL